MLRSTFAARRPLAAVRRSLFVVLLASPLAAQTVPDTLDGWPVIELTRATRANGETWVGTYGHGVLVHAPNGTWRRIRSDTTKTSLSWDFVQAIAFGPRDQVWVGTVGNGWGLSRDDGRTWRNWTLSELGPEWQYVARGGIATRGDTTIITTADGLQLTLDDGTTWIAVGDTVGPPVKGPASVLHRLLPTEYLTRLSFASSTPTQILLPATQCDGSRLRSAAMLLPLTVALSGREPRTGEPVDRSRYSYQTVQSHVDVGAPPRPETTRPGTRPWSPPFIRPIRACDNQHIDQTYRWGSTMGGNFQPHQGIEFNNADGTPVLAIGPGVVAWSGPAERGALTVAIRHDEPLRLVDGTTRFVYSVYYHNSALDVQVGDRVLAGEVIARVGNTGRATNDHLHLEVHASPVDSVRVIVDPEQRFPPHVTNPELWIAPLPRTGAIAGQVFEAAGQPVPQARIYGIEKPLPRETPFAFAETYGPRNAPSPMYGEHFAISDVPAGTHRLRTRINGTWVEREVTVAAGQLSWVEFRP
jgi:murein DD-endopeptidase MepM/ murein hydrolase activator NlpD